MATECSKYVLDKFLPVLKLVEVIWSTSGLWGWHVRSLSVTALLHMSLIASFHCLPTWCVREKAWDLGEVKSITDLLTSLSSSKWMEFATFLFSYYMNNTMDLTCLTSRFLFFQFQLQITPNGKSIFFDLGPHSLFFPLIITFKNCNI
jgi:hypothetical protein